MVVMVGGMDSYPIPFLCNGKNLVESFFVKYIFFKYQTFNRIKLFCSVFKTPLNSSVSRLRLRLFAFLS